MDQLEDGLGLWGPCEDDDIELVRALRAERSYLLGPVQLERRWGATQGQVAPGGSSKDDSTTLDAADGVAAPRRSAPITTAAASWPATRSLAETSLSLLCNHELATTRRRVARRGSHRAGVSEVTARVACYPGQRGRGGDRSAFAGVKGYEGRQWRCRQWSHPPGIAVRHEGCGPRRLRRSRDPQLPLEVARPRRSRSHVGPR